MLLQYFGEKITSRCGTCDYCRSRNKLGVSDEQFDLISEKVISLVKLKPQPVNALLRELQIANEDNALAVIQWMVDNHQIEYSEDNRNELRISE
jgi:ATP-dependent DNA helicase RecQ